MSIMGAAGCIAPMYVGKPRQCEIHHRPASLCDAATRPYVTSSRAYVVCCVIRTQCCSKPTKGSMGKLPQITVGRRRNISGDFVELPADTQQDAAHEGFERCAAENLLAPGAGPVGPVHRAGGWEEACVDGSAASVPDGFQLDDFHSELIRRRIAAVKLRRRTPTVGTKDQQGVP